MRSKFSSRNLIFLYIVLALLITLMPCNVFAASDISGHWAKEQINEWSSKDLIKGYSDNTFKPDNNITRAEFFALINKVFGYQEKAEIQFSDVTGSAWYHEEIARAVAAGYAAGYPDGTIRPQAYITRQEAAAVVTAAFGLKDGASGTGSQFKDSGLIENWAKGSVSLLMDKGIFSGYPDGTFGPAKNIKRAETVIILANASGKIVNQPGTYTNEARGNLVVNVGDVILKDMTVEGDLYLAEGIGDGEVTLDGVVVKGKTLVRGGGENSVILRNTILGDVEVNKPKGSGQPVRILSEGSTSVSGTVTVNSGIKLEEKNVSQGATGFNNVIVSDRLPEAAKVQFSGVFKEVTLTTKQGTIEISKDAVVSKVTVQAAAKVIIAEGAKVATVTVTETAKGANIEAKAEVKVQVQAENVIVNNTTITSGNTAAVSSGGAVTTPSTGSSNSSSSNSGSDDDGPAQTSVTLAIPPDGLIPFHFDVTVKNSVTNDPVSGLVVSNFSLKKGSAEIPLNLEMFHEHLSEDPQYNMPGRYTVYPTDEYRPMEGDYILTFSRTGYAATTATFTVEAPEASPNAIQGADVDITIGSAVFDYGFYGTDNAPITYAEALADPYNLDLAASTVRLEKRSGETVTQATYNITLSALNITQAGTVSYADLNAVEAAFGNPGFMNVWQGPPTHIVLKLKGGSGDNAWELNPITVQFEQSDMDAFESVMPLPEEVGPSGPFVPGDGGALPAFTAFSAAPGKIGGLYVERSERENLVFFEGDRPVVDLHFLSPQEYGAAGYTLQYSEDNGSTWQSYQENGVDVTTGSDSVDLISIYPGGGYMYRLLVNGGGCDGYTSNEVEAPLSAITTAFSGWSLDESLALTGVMTPFVGSGKEASFTVKSLSDSSDIQGYLTYQWYRVNPESFEMTAIQGATDLTYITSVADTGYYLLCRATGDDVNVGGFIQIISHWAPEIPNKVYVSSVTPTGFRLNFYNSVSGLTHEDFKLYYYNDQFQQVVIPITSVTHVENNAVFDVSAELPDGVTSFSLENTSPFWRMVTDSGQEHMITPSVEISLAG